MNKNIATKSASLKPHSIQLFIEKTFKTEEIISIQPFYDLLLKYFLPVRQAGSMNSTAWLWPPGRSLPNMELRAIKFNLLKGNVCFSFAGLLK